MVGVHGVPMTDLGAPSATIWTGLARQHLTWVGAAAMVASLLMTNACRLGYRDFRSALLVRAVAADLVWSVPTLVTLNPIGAPIAHAGLHVTAVWHSYETDVFLPPHR